MSDKGTKTLIGFFVLGALALFILFVSLLGSGFFTKNVNDKYALYFESSLKGLTQGSPVYMKGIKIGKVDEIRLLSAPAGQDDGSSFDLRTVVIAEIENSKIDSVADVADKEELKYESMSKEDFLHLLYDSGLRAKLGMASFLTGQLCIELDFMKSPTPYDKKKLRTYRGYYEIPTQLSSIDKALETLESIPIRQVMRDATDAFVSLSKQLKAIDFEGLISDMRVTSRTVTKQVDSFGSLRDDMGRLITTLNGLASMTGTEAKPLMRSAGSVLSDADKLVRQMTSAVEEAKATMESLRSSSDAARGTMGPDSAAMLEFSRTLQALQKAAKAISDLSTMLEIQPNSIIFGRKAQ
ncbi:MAG: MlaD family protein [Mailhella sp.]|nr:MlaD family protein [Mailhella sp.]